MVQRNRSILFAAAALVLVGLSLVIIAVPRAGGARPTAALESSASPQMATLTPQGKALAKQFSEVFENAAAIVNPSVVPIFAEEVVQVQNPYGYPDDLLRRFFGDDFFKHFMGPQGPEERTVHSLGSGVIVGQNGYILTNNHVVKGAQQLTVLLPDHQSYSAKVVGTDPLTDMAVINIEAKNLQPATLGNSDSVKVGEWVIAVGNPFELLHTVTAGIISAKGRASIGLADYEDFIQTDASINPGNSGGALSDLDGNVIGINTAISSPSGGSVGIGFAIPINMARQVMDQLIAHGRVIRGYLAVLVQDISPQLAQAMNLKSTNGALVADVNSGGPAAKAGIERGDVIVTFNGQKVTDSADLRNEVASTAPGTSVKIALIRNGKQMQVTAVVAERPETRAASSQPQQETEPSTRLGLTIQTLTPDIARQLGYEGERGVVVTAVAPGSAAENAGLQVGDLILEVNRHKVTSVAEFKRDIAPLKSGASAALLVQRGKQTFFAAIQVP